MPIPSRASPGCSFPPASRTRRRARPSRSSSPGCWPTGSSSPHRSTTRRCRRPWSRSSRRRSRRSGSEGPSHGARRSPVLSRGPRRAGPGATPETARRPGVSRPVARLGALGDRHRGHDRRRAAAALGAGAGGLRVELPLDVDVGPGRAPLRRPPLHLRDARHHRDRDHDRAPARPRRRGLARRPADAARRGPGARRHALGDGARRGRPLRALGHPGLGLPRPGTRARRDHGGDHGDRQPARDLRLALRARLHDGGGARQRVHRGDRRGLSGRAGRDRAGAVRDHAGDQRARAAPDRQRPGGAGRPAPMNATYRRRRRVERLMFGATAGTTFATLGVLVFLLGYIAWQGATSLSWSFFTALPAPVGEAGGGMANAIVGSAKLLLTAAAVGIPVGFLGGVYLAEYGRGSFASWVRYAADVLNGIPSIVIGITVYALVVIPIGHFSTLAGGLALGVMMVPVALRSTEEFLRLVPDSLREAALALGAPRWVTIVRVVIPAASRGITTGLLLSLARVAGETAPLLFTALNNRLWSPGWLQPTASLPVMIFTYAIAPYEDWHRQAWAAGLVLLVLVLGTNVLARFLLRSGAVRSA